MTHLQNHMIKSDCERHRDILEARLSEARSQRRSAAESCAMNWLEGHSRILNFWLERLVSENGDAALIQTLHDQETWLKRRLARIEVG